MEITISGSASGMPELNKRHSCVYIKKDGISFMLDCGEGASQAFLENNYSFEEPDFIVISHYHPDHITGIYMLIQLLYLKQRKKTLQIFLPENEELFKETLKLFYLFTERLTYKIEFYSTQEIQNYYPFISAFKTNHLIGYKELVEKKGYDNQLNSFGLNIEHNNKKISYTSDIKSISKITEYLENSNFCIIDAIHPRPEEFLMLEDLIRDKIILTHGLNKALIEKIKNKGKFEIADEKKTFIIS